jgi:hypothetical protein
MSRYIHAWRRGKDRERAAQDLRWTQIVSVLVDAAACALVLIGTVLLIVVIVVIYALLYA